MTTNPTDIAASLSDTEIDILQAMPIYFIGGNEIDKNYLENYRNEIQSLKAKKLIRPTLTHYKRIELGDQYYATLNAQPQREASESSPVASGNGVEVDTTGHPPFITASQFFRENYTTKIEANECKATDSTGKTISAINKIPDHSLSISYKGRESEHRWVSPLHIITLEWLTPPTDAPAPVTEGVVGDEVALKKSREFSVVFNEPERKPTTVVLDQMTKSYVDSVQENEMLQAEVTRLQVALAAAESARDAAVKANGILAQLLKRVVRAGDMRAKAWNHIQANDDEREILWDSHQRIVNLGKEAQGAINAAQTLAAKGNTNDHE